MTTTSLTLKVKTMSESIVNKLKAHGLSDSAIAGIMGNIDVETGGSFDYKTKQKGGKGYGLFQFDYLKPYYKKWLRTTKQKDSEDAQLKFFMDTVYGKHQDVIGAGNAAKLRDVLAKGDPATVATSVSDIWLQPGKPHLERRVESAWKFAGGRPVESAQSPSVPPQQQEEVQSLSNPFTKVVDWWKNAF